MVCLGAVILVVLFAARPGEQAAGFVISVEEAARREEFAERFDTKGEDDRAGVQIQDNGEITEVQIKDEFTEAVVSASYVAVYLLIVLLAALIVIFMIYSIQKRAARQFEDFDEDITEENADLTGLSAVKRKTRLKMGADRTIRRLFRSKVREHMSSNGLLPHRYDTPEVLSGEISHWEDVEMLKLLYHKARYSRAGVSRAELNDYYARRKGRLVPSPPEMDADNRVRAAQR